MSKFNQNNQKYVLLEDDKFITDRGEADIVLHRIVAVRDFGRVKAGELGGYIECEENLSHSGDCWVAGDAKVWGNAIVSDDAKVLDEAEVYGDSHVFGNSRVFENADVESSSISGGSEVYGNCRVWESMVTDKAVVSGNAGLTNNTVASGKSQIRGDVFLHHTTVSDNVLLSGRVYIQHSEIRNDTHLSGNVRIYKGSIHATTDVVTLPLLSFSKGFITVYKSSNGKIMCQCEDSKIHSSIDELVTEFLDEFECTSNDVKQLRLFIDLVKVRFDIREVQND